MHRSYIQIMRDEQTEVAQMIRELASGEAKGMHYSIESAVSYLCGRMNVVKTDAVLASELWIMANYRARKLAGL